MNVRIHKEGKRKFLHVLNRYPKWILITIMVLIVIRAFLPMIGKWVINREFDQQLGAYQGHIDDFDLTLYRGAYQLQGLEIRKKDADLPPILSVDEINISISWRSLIHKMITTDITIKRPEIHLVDSENKKDKQFGLEEALETWHSVFDTVFPVKIESFIIQNGSMDFTNHDLKEPMMMQFEQVSLNARDLHTRPSEILSPFSMEGVLQGHSHILAEGSLDILSSPPKIDMDFQFEKFHLKSINKLLLAYIPIDVTKGDLSAYGEVASAGEAVGYLKVFYRDGDIIKAKQDYKGVKHFFIEIIGAFGNWILENNKTKKVAAKIPFHIHDGKLDVNTTKAFWSAVKNAGNDLPQKIDDSISLKSLGKASSSDQTADPSKKDAKVKDKPIKGQKSEVGKSSKHVPKTASPKLSGRNRKVFGSRP